MLTSLHYLEDYIPNTIICASLTYNVLCSCNHVAEPGLHCPICIWLTLRFCSTQACSLLVFWQYFQVS